MGELWFGGTIYTMNQPGEQVEAILTQDGAILAAGNELEIRDSYASSISTEYDLQGNVLYPGFVDSHLHIIGHGEKLMRLDLSQMTSVEEMKQALSAYATQLPEGEWLIGEGWNENLWEVPSVPHKDELDAISDNHPIMLTRVCRHALIANSHAMSLAGITEKSEDPQGGKIDRDQDGRITGYFLDTAQDLIKSTMPEIKQNYLERAIKLSVQDLWRHGIVGGHTEDLNYYGGFFKTHQAYLNTVNGDHLKFRAHLLVYHGVVEDMVELGHGYKTGTDYVEFGAMKIFADGAIGGRTAWLSEDYEDDPGNVGMPIHEQEALKRLIKQARDFDLPVAVHTIGDKAVEAVIESIMEYPPTSPGLRDRIIHAQFLREDLLEKLQKVNAIIDIQPTFVSSDFPWVIERIGQNRLKHAYAWKTLLKKGIPCAGGSDAPIEQIDPLLGIRAAVLRKADSDAKIYGKDEKLTMFEAVSLYTTGSAYAIGEENRRGKIEVGYLADFTVLDQDLFSILIEKITASKVVHTVVGGDIVYSAS